MKKVWLMFTLLWPLLTAAQVTVDWVQNTEGISIALDANNNVYTVYYEYNPGGDITLTKRNAAGTLLWNITYNQTDNTRWERASWVETDQLGNVVVVGTSMSGYSNPVEAASIIMKFDPNGNLLWRHMYENSFDGSSTKKCIIDNANNIYVLGMGSGPNGYVTKVKKFSPSGTALWSYFDNAGIGKALNFKFTPDNHIVITGRATIGSINGYAKIDLNGNNIWSLPGVNSLTAGDAAGDAFGNTYCVHGEYVSNGGTVIRKISPSGALIWTHTYPMSGFRIEVGSDNMPVISGFPNSGSGGSTFLKADTQGNQVWFVPDADGPNAFLLHAQMRIDQYNHVYLAAGTLFEMGLCKVNSDGSPAWYQTIPGSYANGFCIGSDYNVYVVGGTTARLIQGVTCAVPSGLAASNLSANAATLNWNAVSGATGYQVQYRPVGATTWQSSAATTNTLNISGLTASTLYEFRVSAQCGGGANSDWSGVLRFTTLALPCAPPALNQLYADGITTNSAWLNCSLGGMIAYDWRYRPVGAQNWIDLPTTNSSFVQLTGLIHSTAYEFQVAVQCNINWSDWSATQTFTTDTPPCITPTPAQLSVSNITTNSARLQCSMSGVDQYDWRYRPVGAASWTDLPATTLNFYNLSGLEQFTAYEFQVAVLCQGVWTDWSAAKSFTTDGNCVAPTPAQLFATNITSSSARLNCSVSGVGAYDWRYRVQGAANWVELPATTSNFTDITALTASTSYEFQVAVMCGPVWSAWSASQLFSTSAIPCPIPDVSQLYVTGITTSGAVINCSLNGVDSYDWRYRVLGAINWIDLPATTANAFALTGLTASTQYEFQVSVRCGAVWTDWSASKLFATLDAGCFPPNMGQIFVSNLMPTSVRLNCSVTGVDAYDWRYKLNSDANWTDLPTTTVNFTDVAGLLPLSQYQFQVSVLCGSTWSQWSSPLRFLTPGSSLAADWENGSQSADYEEQAMVVYPVPAENQLNLNYKLQFTSALVLTIIDGNGKVVYQENMGILAPGELTSTIDLQGYVPGVYYLQLLTAQGISRKRFLKM